eukprot:11632712-Karenia_brevis.AAC.1
MPTLLLRPENPKDDAGSEARIRNTLACDFRITNLLRKRLQKAELGKWDDLLDDYLEAVRATDERRRTVMASDEPPREDLADIHERVVKQVAMDSVARAVHTLLDVPRPPKTAEVAQEMADLVCVPAGDDEKHRIFQEMAA